MNGIDTHIRIVIVDDAVLIRHALCQTLRSDASLEVVGIAMDGKMALENLKEWNPDVVLLEIEIPKIDGITLLRHIRRQFSKIKIIILSTVTQSSAQITFEALAAGADDYLLKPSRHNISEFHEQPFRDELISKIKALTTIVKPECQYSSPPPFHRQHPMPSPVHPTPGMPFQILAIGCSTGGPNALAHLFSNIPSTFPLPIVIVQHMPSFFTSLLARRLNQSSAIPIQEAKHGDILKPGQAWLAPGDFHMVLEQRSGHIQIVLNQNPPENSCRPAVDPLFCSVAHIFGATTLALILTGMGKDGLEGSKKIHASGGQVWAQDQRSSVVWGMPGWITKAGLASKVLPLQQMVPELLRQFPFT